MTITHCIVCHRRGRTPSEDLLAALERRGLRVSSTPSIYLALARLSGLTHAADRGDAAAAPVLLLDQPADWEGAAELVRAAGRFTPDADLWMYEPTQTPPLRGVTDADTAAWSDGDERRAEAEIRVIARAPRDPALRLVGSDDAAPQLQPEPHAQPHAQSHPEPATPESAKIDTPEPEPAAEPERPGDDAADPLADRAADAAPPSTLDLLSDEELDMLLRDNRGKRDGGRK